MLDTSRNDNILYELLVYSEWTQDPDLKYSSKLGDSHVSLLWNPIGYFKKTPTLTDEICRILNWQLPWKFAAGEQGKVVAILQDNLLEIRTSRDEYSSVVGKAIVGKDSMPQWRRLAWSPDCSMLAVASSNGSVHFYDLLGSNLFNIPSVAEGNGTSSLSNERALAGILFISPRTKNPKWSSELLLVDYSGHLRSYFVSPTDNFLEQHSFQLSKTGVSSMAWHSSHNMIFVSSIPDKLNSRFKENGIYWGLSAWRLLNDYPYYKLAVPSVDEIEIMQAQRGIWNFVHNFRSTYPLSVVFCMRVSPLGNYLACLHTCGTISVWTIPALKLYKMWKLDEQIDSKARNLADKKYCKETDVEDAYPIDLNWWPEEKIIIARRNGAVSVCEMNDLKNLLGDNPEFLCGEPALSSVCTDRGFLALECDVQVLSNKRKLQSQPSQEQEENTTLLTPQLSQNDQESSDDEETSILRQSTELIQSTVYFFTDIEQFRPKKKRPKVIQRTYRLLGLKSTTPEELFTRKIDNEEYGEALALAQTYGLDADRVYQRQWRNSPVSIATIHDYLSKISKYSWVLQECCERVPETLSAAKELIIFGLNMTETQLKEGVCCDDFGADGEIDARFDDLTDDDKNNKESNWKVKLESLSNENLSDEIKRLICTRLKLFRYSDRLHTYQMILNCDNGVADDNFDREFYNKFRSQDTVVSAIEFARQGNFKAVEYLLTYHGSETVKHWLKILENFPETMLPSQYSYLLPECSSEGEVFEWKISKIREEDWCETDKFKCLLEELDEVSKDHIPNKIDNSLTPTILTDWYKARIYQLERCSHIVDPALDLIKLARERYIKGLDELHHQLLTLDVLVYDLNMEDLDLGTLEKKTPLEKALLLVSNSTEESFVSDVQHRICPYLNRCEELNQGTKKTLLTQMLKSFSVKSLSLPYKLFQYLRDEPTNPILSTVEDRILLTLECLYANSEVEDLDNAFKILAFLPDRIAIESSKEMDELCKRLDDIEAELDAAVILHKYGQFRSIMYIHNNAKDQEAVKKLVLRIARSTANKIPSAPESVWNDLLTDILKLQNLVFGCLPLELCYELYVSTVLASGNPKIIRSAMKILCCCGDDKFRKPLSLDRSVFLVLQAAREYFDSAGSLTDPGIQLSKTCLNLIIEENNDILEEQDLIQSLQILYEFNVTLLPMQVRLCSDRMRLVESCLQGHPAAYRNLQKLLTLAEKLRVCGNENQLRKGKVLVRIAEAAFAVKDFAFCCGVCNTLIEEEHSVGWEICQKLGQCSECRDSSVRKKCVVFAILHCPPSNIQGLLETRCDLERELLQFEISSKVSSLESYNISFDQDDEFVDALTSPSTPSKEFLPQLTSKLQSTTKFLSKVAGTDFWKNSLNRSFGDNGKDKSQIAFDNSGLKKQAFPGFYASLHPRCHLSAYNSLFNNSNDFNEKKLEQFRLAYILLQSALLEEEKEDSHSVSPLNSVLVQCSQLIMSEDCCLGLGFLLSLTDESIAEQCFTALPQSLLCLQLALYFYSIIEVIKKRKDVFSLIPEDVISLALEGPPQCEDIYKLIQRYKAKLENYLQAEKMKELNCGVNIDRFTEDSQYKQDSILGLAMSHEWEKVELALELGQIHGVNGYEVAVSHIVSLLLSGNHQLVIDHVADNKLASLLQDQPQFAEQQLIDSVFPNINGSNHQLMIAYYTVLQCVAGNSLFDGLLPKDHIKLIKKVKATSSAIDYKALLREPLLKVFRPVLNKESAANIARLLKTLPQHIRGATTVSQLYVDLLNTDFFYQCLGFSAEKESIHQFSLLKGFFSKVTPEDLVYFVKTCIFSRSCAQQLSPAARASMVSEVIGFCLQYKNSDAHGLAVSTLKKCLDHLSYVWSMSVPQATNENIRNFLIELDISCGEEDLVIMAIGRALADKVVPFSLIVDKTPKEESLPSIITKTLNSDPPPSVVDVLLTRVESCLEKNMKDPNWNSLLEGFAANSELSAQSRLLVVSLLQKLTEQHTGNLPLLTEAVLGRRVNSADVETEQARSVFFFELLKEVNSWSELCTLKHLIMCWPPFTTLEPSSSPSLQLILKMANFESCELLSHIGEIITENNISEQGIQWLVDKLESKGNSMVSIWICLHSSESDLHLKALQQLENTTVDLIPEEVVRRFIQLDCVAKIFESAVYSEFIESLLVLSDGDIINSTVQQLIDAEHVSEAGNLILMYSGVPLPLRTFSAALEVIANFKRN